MSNQTPNEFKREMLHSALQEIFANTNEWLRFSEAKNAAFAAFNVAAAVGVATVINDMEQPPSTYVMGCQIFLGMMVIAAVLSLLSFFPRIRKLPEIEDTRLDDQASVIFFGHLAQMRSEDFLKRLCNKIGYPVQSVDGYHRDQAYQIVTNSKIARGKFLIFRWAVIITTLSFPAGCVPALYDYIERLMKCHWTI